jgi:fructokinase
LRQNYFSREIIESSLQAADILKLNDDELAVLRDIFGLPKSPEAALQTLLSRYQLDCIAFTQGAAGSMMMDANKMFYCPGIAVTVKDTVGAGDSFTATLVMGMLYGLPLEKINRLAGKVAAYVCSQAGATPALPDYLISELKQEMPIPIHEIPDSFPAQRAKTDDRKANQSLLSS